MLWKLLRETDVDDFFAYCRHPEVGPAAGWPPHEDKGTSRNVMWKFMEAGDVWALVDRQTRRVIGSVGLHEDKRRDNPNCRMLRCCATPSKPFAWKW